MIELFPEGFEELDTDGAVELVAYTSGDGEERLWRTFGGANAADVESGWEDRWRDFHRPVVVGGLWIGPPWETPPGDLPAVVIDPARAFGTGSHPTTRLCLELLAERPRGSVLDVGCGSGVLAIAAARLGHGPVLAIDDDSVAVETTTANAVANGVEVDARVVDATTGELPAADLVVANIAPGPVASLSGRVRCAAAITAGYLVSDAPSLAGFAVAERRQIDGWAADLHLPE
jgi:ribosomal protein L11 methyltransferase